ncbi:MAG: hypothetical protein M1830_003968 [Pleopsidium flavum]|nr:MAG: hypothetical protein M1830_003968 [Pleopsidium flavum]
MSLDVVERMKIPVQPLSEVEIHLYSFVDASGNKLVPLGKANATWFWKGSCIPQTHVFYIAPREGHDMILGADYIFGNKIFIENKEYVLPLATNKESKKVKAQNKLDQAAQATATEKRIAQEDEQRKRDYDAFQKARSSSAQKDSGHGASGSNAPTK